jgi:hypothetical protein
MAMQERPHKFWGPCRGTGPCHGLLERRKHKKFQPEVITKHRPLDKQRRTIFLVLALLYWISHLEYFICTCTTASRNLITKVNSRARCTVSRKIDDRGALFSATHRPTSKYNNHSTLHKPLVWLNIGRWFLRHQGSRHDFPAGVELSTRGGERYKYNIILRCGDRKADKYWSSLNGTLGLLRAI